MTNSTCCLCIDTADISEIRKSKVSHATNNPSIILSALRSEEMCDCLKRAVNSHKKNNIFDHLLFEIGLLILNEIDGTLSTQLDPRLAYDSPAMVFHAHHLIKLFEIAHIPRERIYIKLPATWEGMTAASLLEKEGIRCNVTLVFSVMQALAAAQAQASMIAPYVGRVCDWAKAKNPHSDDFGVHLVSSILAALRNMHSPTQVMAASFRNLEQIHALLSCDFLTIHPALLQQLSMDSISSSQSDLKYGNDLIFNSDPEFITKNDFLQSLSQDVMSNELLSHGLQRFVIDTQHIEASFIN